MVIVLIDDKGARGKLMDLSDGGFVGAPYSIPDFAHPFWIKWKNAPDVALAPLLRRSGATEVQMVVVDTIEQWIGSCQSYSAANVYFPSSHQMYLNSPSQTLKEMEELFVQNRFSHYLVDPQGEVAEENIQAYTPQELSCFETLRCAIKERRGGEDYEGMPIRLLVNPPRGWSHLTLSGETGFTTLLRHLFSVHEFTAQEEAAWVRADARLQAIFDDHRAGVQRAVLQNALVAVPPLQPLAKRKI